MTWRLFGNLLVRLMWLGVAALMGAVTWRAFQQFTPLRGHLAYELRSLAPVLTMGPASIAALAAAAGRAGWVCARWTARAGITLITVVGWRYHTEFGWQEYLGGAGLVGVTLFAHHIAHRQALGWFYDSRGERQKVLGFSRGHYIFVPTTRSQRIVEEHNFRKERRGNLFWLGVVGWPLAYFAYHQYQAGQWFWVAVLGFFASFALLPWTAELATELLYLSGYQDMKGHRVLDPEPIKPGIQDVAQQMAYGQAGFASPDEIDHLLGGR